MKIKMLIISIITSCNICNAQCPVIEVSHNYTTQLIFPKEINFCRLAVNEKFFEPQQINNILLIQAVENFDETNLTVLLNNGLSYSVKLKYNPKPSEIAYIFQPVNAVNYKLNTSSDQEEGTDVPEGEVIEKIVNQNGYIASRNAVKTKSFLFSVTGIYINNNKIYIRLAGENLSQIPYKIDLVNFAIGVKKTKEVTSSGLEILQPLAHTKLEEIPSKEIKEFVFTFNKFTIGKDNELIVDLIEQSGSRNISLTISDELFLTAKKI